MPTAAVPLVVSVVTEVAPAFSPASVEVPVTPSVPPMVVLFVIEADARVESPAVSPASVVAPVTPKVVPTVAAPVIEADAIVEAPALNTSTLVIPITSSVPPTVAAPVTSAEANVEAPASSTPRVDVPATSRVPDRSMLVRAMSASRSIVTSSFRSCVVTLVPPVTVRVSVRRSTVSAPESAATLRLVPISVVEADVIRPFASTLITGT